VRAFGERPPLKSRMVIRRWS